MMLHETGQKSIQYLNNLQFCRLLIEKGQKLGKHMKLFDCSKQRKARIVTRLARFLNP